MSNKKLDTLVVFKRGHEGMYMEITKKQRKDVKPEDGLNMTLQAELKEQQEKNKK